MLRNVAGSIFPVLLAAAAAHAQDSRARVQGIVSDTTGAVVAGATVVLSNDNTGVQAQQTTNQIGQYIFDFVLPGTYTVTIEMSGFRRFVNKNVLVQSRGDVTVNASLELGATSETINVEASPVAVQFNTSTMALTIDTKMANQLPIVNRNPFLLVALNPATVVRSSNEQSPFHHWAPNEFDVGGGTNRKNDIILDGAPSMTSQKSSYTPPMDAVQEVTLQQNAVDAEFGHSAGGIISLQMKSGTNEFHGTAYYLGRNPALNALADRITRGRNLTKQHVWGVTSGNPIVRNKVFNFFSYEGWRTIEPRSAQYTMPTELERRGDFSQSKNTQGALRTIYDPYTTQTQGNVVTRQPFAGNIIPASRIDPTSAIILQDVWQPNSPGSGATQQSNFLAGFANRFRYWNMSNRTDWNVSDRLKVFGRYNQFRTFTRWDDFTGGSRAQQPDGSKRHALSFSGDAVWTLDATTVFNIRGAYNSITDSFGVPEKTLQASDLDRFWPGNAWYSSYLNDLPDIYYPGITVRAVNPGTAGAAGNTQFGRTGYWYQEPKSWNVEAKLSKNIGQHYVKFGSEFRKEITAAARPRPMSFDFQPALTSNTYNNPNTALSGDAWASFLLGVIDQNSTISSIPIQRPNVSFLGLFVQDDWKITKDLTLNLGLRYEYFTPMIDPEDRLSRFLDLNDPIPEFQGAGAPTLPAQVMALRTAPPVYNGAWVFTDSNNRGSWNAPKTLFMPRIGMAWRLNDRTAIRAGFARYIVPATLTQGLDILGSVAYPGFDATSAALPHLQGVPQQRLSNPYPGGLVPVSGKSLGRYTNLGAANFIWYQQNFTPGVNDRINISLQRQLPWRILADLTYFMNFGRNHPYNYDRNQVDPRIGYANGNVINQAVPNPFFNRLPASKMPGQLRTQQNVAISQLLRMYPQYLGGVMENLNGGISTRYHSFQAQVQRPFVNGLNLVFGYNYNQERNQEFYDEQDTFTRTFTWQPGNNPTGTSAGPRHKLTGASIWDVPVGRGRKFMNSSNALVDGLLGGWNISALFLYASGPYLRFGPAIVTGDPGVDNPTNDRWFDTSKFRVLPPFTRRENPLQYDSVKGPRLLNLDMTLAKEFRLTERVRFELRGEAYNVTNRFTGANPDVNVTSANFGKVVAQRGGYFGRQIQYSGRFIW